MSSKEGFILYTGMYDSIREFLTIEQRGMLMDAIHDYQRDDIEPPKNSPIAMAFAIYKNQFRLDGNKQEKRAESARVNGLRGGRPKEKTKETESVFGETEKTDSVISETNKTQKSYKEKVKVKEKVKEKEKVEGEELPPAPLETPLKEVVFVEQLPKQPYPKPDSTDDETLAYIEETKKIRKGADDMQKAYGKYGAPARVEQELRDAVKYLMEAHGASFDKSLDKIISQAAKQKAEYERLETTEKFMKDPESWLALRCYAKPIGPQKKPNEQLSDEEKYPSPMSNPALWDRE